MTEPVRGAELEQWFARWREGRIGFHEGKPNAFLERHFDRLAGKHRVLVPLCGKSDDLAYLTTRGLEVVGVELVETAVQAFFAEHQLEPEVTHRGAFAIYRAGPITVLAGDFFAATPKLVGTIDALYDRAALIALSADLRRRYAEHVRALVVAGSPGIVVTLEYDEGAMQGPPYSVLEPEIRELYTNVERIDEGPTSVRDNGVSVRERCYGVRF